jgi:YihY family inner membrane protein
MVSEQGRLAFDVSSRAKVPFATLRRGIPKRRIVASTFVYFLKNQLPSSAAAISYFVMLALFPIILLLFDLGNHYPRFREINSYVLETVIVSVPRGAQETLIDYLQSVAHPSKGEIIVCITIVLWAASWGFSIVEQAVNRIWRTSCRSFLHGRLVSVLMIMAIGSLLIISGLATAMLAFFRSAADGIAAGMAQGDLVLSSTVWQVVFSVVGLMLTISLFTLVYKVVPNTHVSLLEALPGAIIAGIAWEIAKYVFAWFLAEVPYEGLYGPLAAVVAALTWIYISNLIMLFGAQMTALLHCEYLVEEQKPKPQIQSVPRALHAAARR